MGSACGSDVIVTVDLSRLRDQNGTDAINGWRHRATTNRDANDIAIALSDWTGREFAHAEIEAWVGRRLTIFTGHWGNGVLSEARDAATATTWLEKGDDGQWTGWVSEEKVWLAQNAETESAIRETNAHGQRTSASAASDYRRANESHTMKGAQVEIFARWRAVPEPWRERLTTVMDGALDATMNTLNRQKGGARRTSGDRPPGAPWCDYKIRWVEVKAKWELTITPTELLGTCGS